jgi:hypothetical protein
MISGDFSYCKNLTEFYQDISALHNKEHGKDYCKVHDEIASLVSGKRYIELGVNQGATLAAALLGGAKSVRAYDININRFDPQRKLFEDFAKDQEIDFVCKKASSLDHSIVEECDILYIDTLHVWKQLSKEIQLWWKSAEIIICHDTNAKPDLRAGIDKTIKMNPYLTLIEHNKDNVGYSVIKNELKTDI